MNIFSKYLFKSMIEKKGRTVLLLASIAISASLLVASLGSIKALLGTLSTEIKANYGDFNVSLSLSKNTGIPIFKPENLKDKSIEKVFRSISIGGYITGSEKEFSLEGTTLSDFQKFEAVRILEKSNLEPFTGKKLIISKKASEVLKLKLGDILKLNILGKQVEYKIAAIATNKGMFFYDKDKRFDFITPEENLFSIYGESGKYSNVLLSVANSDLDSWLKSYNDKNKSSRIIAAKVFDEEQIEQQLAMVKMPLYFMLAIVLLMTAFIIYSSFKLIITERLPVIGVFLSQGATKGKIIRILLRESLAYGIFGGFLGDLVGVGLTNLVAFYGNPLKDYGVKATAEYYPAYFVAGFVFAVILSLASTLIPILSIRKLPVKDVILNTISTQNRVSIKGFVLGIILIIATLILHVTGGQTGNAGAVPSVFLGFVGVVLIIPKLVDVTFYPLVRLLRNINGLSMLSFNNVRTSKVLVNNMRLIAVSIISIVMITSLSVSITDVVKGAYEGMNFDVRIDVNSNNARDIYNIVNEYKDASVINQTGVIPTYLNGDMTKVVLLNYTNPKIYEGFENYTVFNNKRDELNLLDKNEDGIILSKQMSVRYKINKGDIITLTTDNKKEKLRVLSIFNAKMMNSGNYNLISLRGALKHFDVKYPTTYFISTRVTGDKAKLDLEKKLKGLGVNIITKNKMSKDNEKANKQMTDILGIFAYITMVIGAFGILSNVSISFIQRKREIAVMSSIGLTRAGRGYMILLESFFQAIMGCLLSLGAAFCINKLFEDVFKFITMDLDLKYPYGAIGSIVIATMMLMLFTSISSILSSKKLQIVQELKYE